MTALASLNSFFSPCILLIHSFTLICNSSRSCFSATIALKWVGDMLIILFSSVAVDSIEPLYAASYWCRDSTMLVSSSRFISDWKTSSSSLLTMHSICEMNSMVCHVTSSSWGWGWADDQYRARHWHPFYTLLTQLLLLVLLESAILCALWIILHWCTTTTRVKDEKKRRSPLAPGKPSLEVKSITYRMVGRCAIIIGLPIPKNLWENYIALHLL